MSDDATAAAAPTQQRALGLPILALLGLAALGIPRVILHDLHLIEEGSPVTWILSLLPVAVWITVAVLKRVPHPFLTVLMIGVFYGVMLVITHQLLWESAFDGRTIAVGDGPIAALVPRIAAVPSGLFTGAVVGAIGGLIAAGIQGVRRRSAPSD